MTSLLTVTPPDGRYRYAKQILQKELLPHVSGADVVKHCRGCLGIFTCLFISQPSCTLTFVTSSELSHKGARRKQMSTTRTS